MRRTAWLVLLVACSGGRASAPEAEVGADTVGGDTTQPAAAVPDTTFPASRRGALIIRTALPGPFGGEWTPMAGVCQKPPSLQLLASGDSVDVIVFLRLPGHGSVIGTYAIAEPEDTSAAPRTASIGVQLVSYADRALRAESGWVELSQLDQLVSGRLDVVLRGFSAPDTVRYLGVFDRIRVDSLPEMTCRTTPPGVPPEVH